MPEDGLLQRGHGDPMHGDPEVDEDMEEEEPVTQVLMYESRTHMQVCEAMDAKQIKRCRL